MARNTEFIAKATRGVIMDYGVWTHGKHCSLMKMIKTTHYQHCDGGFKRNFPLPLVHKHREADRILHDEMRGEDGRWI